MTGSLEKGAKSMRRTKKKILAAAAGVLVIAAVVMVLAMTGGKSHDEYVYKETQVQFGVLTVGVTESGTVDIGTVEQIFDLDMGALRRVQTNNDTGSSAGVGALGGFSGNSAMGGAAGIAGGSGMGSVLNMFSGLNTFSLNSGMGGNNITSIGNDASLTIANVKVSVGQQVSEGDILYELEEESVSELERKLQADIEKAKADLEAVYASQTLSRETARYTYGNSMAYGIYAETEYNAALQELEDAVENNRAALERAKELLNGYQARLDSVTASYNDALQVLAGCRYSLEHTDMDEDTYLYVYYFGLTQQAQSTADSLKQQKEQLERNIEQAKDNISKAEKSYSAALRNLDQGKLNAGQTLSLRRLAYDTAQETYDITLAYLDEDAVAQEEINQGTQDKWNEFSSYIHENGVMAKHNGIITNVGLAEGDSIHTGSILVSMYDMDNVGMTVAVYEKDMTDIAIGSDSYVSLIAYPDKIFKAEVSEISDAYTNANGNVLYDVSAVIKGDVSGLFQGMTGDITFVTGQSEETLYVSRRAVSEENGISYVKVKNGSGGIEKKEVVTGFTDGTYIQILEGLSEGDTVLIESRVGSL